MQHTKKLVLNMPERDIDVADIDKINENMVKIDKFAEDMGLETESLRRYIDDNSGKEPSGYIQDVGTKIAGNLYRDKLTKGLFYCKANTSINYNSADYFEDYSNYANGNKLQNLYKYVEQTYTGTGHGITYTLKISRRGYLCTFDLKANGIATQDNPNLMVLPECFFPSQTVRITGYGNRDFLINKAGIILSGTGEGEAIYSCQVGVGYLAKTSEY